MSARGRDWRSHWIDVRPLESPAVADALKQVGKTRLGMPVGSDQLDLIIAAIRTALECRASDRIVDLGCGNGLITARVAQSVASVLGLDVSPTLVDDARRFHAGDATRFEVGDFSDPDLLSDQAREFATADTVKLYAYEVLQHLTPDELELFLQATTARFDGAIKLFCGSIPDRARIRAFYDTPERWELYERNVAAGREQIGTWWSADELRDVAERAGFTCERREQDAELYTAHYRFDALLTRPARNER